MTRRPHTQAKRPGPARSGHPARTTGAPPEEPSVDRPLARSAASLGELAVWVLVLAAPFAVSVTSVDVFRLPKLMVSEWLGLASLFALSLAVALGGSRGRGAAAPWWKEPALLAVAPLLAIATLSWLIGDHPRVSRPAVVDLWIAASCLVGWSLTLDRSRLRRLLTGLVIPAAAMAVLAILQFHKIFQPFAFVGGVERFRLGVTALAGNPGDLGDYLALGALVAQWGLLRAATRRHGGRRAGVWLWAAGLVVTVYGLAASQTLTAAAALAVGSVVLWMRALPRRRALTVAAAGLILALAAVTVVKPLRSRVVSVGREVAAGDWNSALTGRLDGWRAAVWMFERHPWTGVGQGAYRAEFGPARLALAARGVQPYRGRSERFFANAHDDYLEAAAEWGLPGLLALAWALWVLLRSVSAGGRLLPKGATGKDGVEDQAFAWGVVAAGAVLALAHFPFHLALVAYPYLLVFAWISRRAREETA